jgi:leader peptidase (prepilin peptidase)/N-methyltransferase
MARVVDHRRLDAIENQYGRDVTSSGTVVIVIVAAVLGLMIGSFLNVVIYRVPAGKSVVRPRSACPTCDEPIAERDNIPVLSWLLLHGRSRCCDESISPRYPLVEAATAIAFGVIAGVDGGTWVLPALLYLAAISIALSMIDIDVHRLPNVIVLPSYPVSAALLTLAALADGEPGRLVRAAICGFGLYAFYFVLMVVYPAGMGFGDVKLAGVLGLYLGWFGWQYATVGAFFGFLVGGVYGLVLMLLGRAGRKSQIPFGPFMIIGAWLSLLVAAPITTWYLNSTGIS